MDLEGGASNPWDKVILGGQVLPGLCKVKIGREHKLNVKESAGTHGADVTDQGYKVAQVTITWTIWAPSHWDLAQDVLVNIEPPPKGTPLYQWPKFPILNPVCQSRGVNDVGIKAIDGPDDGSVKGTKAITLHCLHWHKPNKQTATNTPQGALTSGPNALVPGRSGDPSKGVIPGPRGD
jgi:hypothetical protein